MSERLLLIAVCALAVGCAGRALPQPAVGTAGPGAPNGGGVAAPPAAPEEARRAVHGSEYGMHGPPAFPEIRRSSAAVASYSDPAEDRVEEPPAGIEDPAASPAPLIVEVPSGVTPSPPFDAPAPSALPPPPFQPPARTPVPRWAPLPPPRVTVSLPGGDACLKKLAQAGVAFRSLEDIRGIDTPIQIESAIGGIRYHSGFGPMVSDCRFALALATAAPELTALGVSEMHFSGAYSYRTSRVGRLSLHAYGLALDVHEIVVDGRRLSVERDFARGIGCGVGPALNRVACRLRELGLFRELLTPDYNADHNNHFHLGVAPLGPLANELWAKPAVRHPSPRLPVFGNGSRRVAENEDDEAKPVRKSDRDTRDSKAKAPAKSGTAHTDSKAIDEHKSAKRLERADSDSKTKRKRTDKSVASAKAADSIAGEEPKPKKTNSARAKPSEEREDKPATKNRKREKFSSSEKPPKHKRLKAAKRSAEHGKNESSS